MAAMTLYSMYYNAYTVALSMECMNVQGFIRQKCSKALQERKRNKC